MKRKLEIFMAMLLFAGMAAAQQPAQAPTPAPGAGKRIRVAPPGGIGMGPMTARHHHLMGQWWKNSEVVNELHLTEPQVREIEQSFLQHRLQLIDANAAVQKLDTRLEALMNADQLNEAEINQVLDELVQARGQLSRTYTGMLVSIRKVLQPEQWKKLQALRAEHGLPHMPPGAPGMFMRAPGPPGMFEHPLPPPVPPVPEMEM